MTGAKGEECFCLTCYFDTESFEYVRVYVASSFGDMMAERRAIMNHVFPRLVSRCMPLRLKVILVDLRCGLSEYAFSEMSKRNLFVLLREIDKCRPLFVAILGERFFLKIFPRFSLQSAFLLQIRRRTGRLHRSCRTGIPEQQ